MRRWLLMCVLTIAGCVGGPVPERQLPAAATILPRSEGTRLRVLAWNVSRESFYQNLDGFRRVLGALDADILILDEMPAAVDGSALKAALQGLGGHPDWQVVYGSGGGDHQRSSIASRLPLTRVDAFDDLRYPEEMAERWVANSDIDVREKLRDSLRSKVANVAAVAEHDGRRLLVIGVDLQCCGNGPNSWQEQRRRSEARLIRAAIDINTPLQQIDSVIVGGDFNAVNGPSPLLLIAGEGDRPWQLDAAPAKQLDGVDVWTWDGRGTPFASGRLDYIMHDPSLQPLGSWVFDSADLDPAQLSSLGLPAEAMVALSQHRPVVVDLTWSDRPTLR